jgi:cystathionine beta-synthase
MTSSNGHLGGDGQSSGDTHHWLGVLDSALDAVGHTPLIKLQRIAKEEGFECTLCKMLDLWVKGRTDDSG